MKPASILRFHKSNAQAVVETESMLIVGQRVCNAANDKEQLASDVQSIPASIGKPKNVLSDSGFYSEKAVNAVEQNPDGTPTEMTVYAAMGKTEHHRSVQDLEAHPEPEPPAADAPIDERMRCRLKTTAGKKLYGLRKQTVEPFFGIIKSVLGFRQFLLRGAEKVSAEWTLVCLAWNLKRLHRLGMEIPTGCPA